ncbi:MAG: MerR family transcriptional regulator [Saprospiraceae bacterium]|nr:MerR family transcriptional regulator [Saprospiraceae bacterium]
MKSIDTQNLDKLYYTIGEVADMFEVSRSLLRYWENEFSFLTPRKNRKGDRLFTKENIQQIQIIYNLVKERGFTLEGAKQELRKEKNTLGEQFDLVDRLKVILSKLKDLDKKLSS